MSHVRKKAQRIIRELLEYFQQYRWAIALGSVLMALGLGLSLAVPLISRRIIDDGLLRRDIHKINQFGMIFLIVAALSFIVSMGRQYLFQVLQQRIMVDMRGDLTLHILRLPMHYLNREVPGYLLSRVNGDVDSLAGLMTDKFIQALFDFLTVLCAIFILAYINWRLALLTSILMPFFLCSLRYFSNKSYAIGHALREVNAQLLSRLEELLASVYLVKLFHTEEGEVDSYVDMQNRVVTVNLRAVRINLLSSLAIGSVATASPLIVIWYGGLQVVEGRMSIGSLFAFNMYLAYLFTPLRSLYESVVSFYSSLASFDRIHTIRSVPEQEAYAPAICDNRAITRGEVEFRNVTFSYNPEQDVVLHDLCFRAEAGVTTAVVGRSGAGKTTIFNLLLKLYEQYYGEIILDGMDLRTINLGILRRGLRLVPQEAFLLNRTVFENIAYGHCGATAAEVHKAAEIALADEFIRKLPNGYETVIGSRGATLSGGERQRLALARAMVSNPKVLLLDEATAFLDSDTEFQVQQAMENSVEGRTCIVVAHRLNTVLRAHKICLLEDGKVQAFGTHAELYSRCAPYRILVDKQFLVDEVLCKQR
jgi:subfamily B ATP-binding cassette protein MsbA